MPTNTSKPIISEIMQNSLLAKLHDFNYLMQLNTNYLATSSEAERASIAEEMEARWHYRNKQLLLKEELWESIEMELWFIFILMPNLGTTLQSKKLTTDASHMPRDGFDDRCTSNLNELVQQDVISDKFLQDLLQRENSKDEAIQKAAKSDLAVLKQPNICNVNKKQYVNYAAYIKQEDKNAFLHYLDHNKQHNDAVKNMHVFQYWQQLNRAEQKIIHGFVVLNFKLFIQDRLNNCPDSSSSPGFR